MSTTNRRKIHWLAVVFPIAGIALCVLAAVRGDLGLAVAYLVITFGFAAVLVFFPGFTEAVLRLGDDFQEERNVYLHRRASHMTVNVVSLFVAGVVTYETFRGGDVGPYVLVGGVGIVTYFACLLLLNWRS